MQVTAQNNSNLFMFSQTNLHATKLSSRSMQDLAWCNDSLTYSSIKSHILREFKTAMLEVISPKSSFWLEDLCQFLLHKYVLTNFSTGQKCPSLFYRWRGLHDYNTPGSQSTIGNVHILPVLAVITTGPLGKCQVTCPV